MRGTNKKNAKLGHTGSGRGHMTYFWNFGTPTYLRTSEARNFKFACI